MSQSKNVVIAVLALTTIASTFLAWRQHSEIEQLVSSTRLNGPAVVPPITLRSGTGRYVTLVPPRRASAAPRVDERMESFQPGTGFGGGSRPIEPAPRRDRTLLRLIENPEFLQALDVSRQGMLDTRFAALFRQLNLSATELAAFKQLLTEKENVALDVFAVSENSPDGPLSPAAMRQSVNLAQAQVENAILSSLGDERYAVYRDYERTVAQRATVAQLEQRLSYSSAPLTPTQAESLVQILAANTPARVADPIPAISVVVGVETGKVTPVVHTAAAPGRVTDEAIASAQTVLATEQVAALREIQLEQQAAVRASELIQATIPIDDQSPTNWRLLLQ